MFSHRGLPSPPPNGHGELAPAQPWERQPTDTDKAWEAFEIYRSLGANRSLLKVGQQLGKSTTLLSRWSSRHDWTLRAAAWDRYQARTINMRVLQGTAEMRERQAVLAMRIEETAQKRILDMTPEEIALLSPMEVCALLKVAGEMERRAREIPEDDPDVPLAPLAPKFEIQIIRPGHDMIGVQLQVDGVMRYGYVPVDRIDEFRRDHPDATVILWWRFPSAADCPSLGTCRS